MSQDKSAPVTTKDQPPTITPDTAEAKIREIVEQFRKQCINKGGGIGFEETVWQLKGLFVEARIDEVKKLRFQVEIDTGESDIKTIHRLHHFTGKRIAALQHPTIDQAVDKMMHDYGDTLRKLGKE